MPIPFLIGAAIAVVAGGSTLAAVGGHMCAKEKNQEAKDTIEKSQKKYDNAVKKLERAQQDTQESVDRLISQKKHTLDVHLKKFVKAYSKVKSIKLSGSTGLAELDKFGLDDEGFVQLQKLTNNVNVVNSLLGTAAVTGATSVLGGSAVAGVIGIGAMSALSIIAGPAFLVSAFVADSEADKNLEKANVFASEVKVATKKMKISRTLCDAIATKSEMNYNLLVELNSNFVPCVDLLDKITSEKKGFFKKSVNPEELTQEDIELIAVTRALAGAIKQIIDVPLLSHDGTINPENERVITKVENALPAMLDALPS